MYSQSQFLERIGHKSLSNLKNISCQRAALAWFRKDKWLETVCSNVKNSNNLKGNLLCQTKLNRMIPKVALLLLR